MKPDKSKHTILPMSKFGIIEMTRQKRGSKISNIISEKCLVCNGYGLVQDKVSVCYEILENIIKNNINGKAVSYTHLRAHETPEQLVCRLMH